MLTTNNTSSNTRLVYAAHVLNYVESTPEVRNALSRYGYDAQQFNIGRQLLAETTNSFNQLESLERHQKELSEQFTNEWKALKQLQQVHLQVARRCLSNELGDLLGKVPNSYASWVVEANRFYTALLNNPNYLAKMNSLGITSDELTRGAQWVSTITQMKDLQNQNRANITLMNQKRQINQKEFKLWFGVLLASTRIALRDQPAMIQLLRPVSRKASTIKLPPTLVQSMPATPLLASYS